MALAVSSRALPRTIPLRCMPDRMPRAMGRVRRKKGGAGSERQKKTNARRATPITADENKMLIGVNPRSSAAHKCRFATPQPSLEGEGYVLTVPPSGRAGGGPAPGRATGAALWLLSGECVRA